MYFQKQIPKNVGIDMLVHIAYEKNIRGKFNENISLEDIFNEICGIFKIKPELATNKRRLHIRVICRQIYCYVARLKTGCSLVEIAAIIGRSEHTTVMYSIKSVEDKLSVKEPDFMKYWNIYLKESIIY